jgi:serine protease Do
MKRGRSLRVSLFPLVLAITLAGCQAVLPRGSVDAIRRQVTRRTATPTAAVAPQSTAAPAPVGTVMVITSSEEEQLLEALYQRVNASVVNVMVTISASGGSRTTPTIPQQGEGSGFVYDAQGHIITNNHVVAAADEIRVTFADGISVAAQVVGTDPDADLAVIQVDPKGLNLQPLPLGDSDALKVGQRVIAIGNPFGMPGTMTTGIVSALGRLLPSSGTADGGRYNIPDIIQTDAAINPGNSGGPLLNIQGQVVGVNAAIESPVRGFAGIGLSIPANTVKKVVPALISQGFYEHPWLGIAGVTVSPAIAQANNLPEDQRGVLVATVTRGSPADKAQLRAARGTTSVQGQNIPVGGDVIVGMDGRPVKKMDDLISYLSRYTEVGQTVRLSVLRDGKPIEVSLTLAARPKTQT